MIGGSPAASYPTAQKSAVETGRVERGRCGVGQVFSNTASICQSTFMAAS